MLKQTHSLQAELQGLEEQEQYERGTSEGGLDAAVHAARNLGQTAVYFLQTGAMEEAATLYQQV